MKLVFTVASRFVFDRARRLSGKASTGQSESSSHGFLTFISSISMAGLALGVTALLVVTSVMNGFERELKGALTSFHSHILLFSRAEPVNSPQVFIKEIKANFPDVVAVSPYVFTEVMLSSSKGVAGSVVEGIDRETVDQVSMLSKKVVSGRLPGRSTAVDPEVAIGVEIARKLKVTVGDSIILTIPFAKKEEAPLVKKLQVVGLIKYGMYEYDNKYTVLELSVLQGILEIPGKVNAFKILTKNLDLSMKTADLINDKYTYPMRAKDWSSLNRNLFYAIRLEKVVISIILLAIVLVASFNIISTIMMMVHDKNRQISMLKALGWTQTRTLFVFILIGMVMSVLGVVLGVGFGRALLGIVQWKSIIDLPADVYMFSRLPVEIRPLEWILICAGTVLLALLSTLWPSISISRQPPVQGLRYE